MLAFSKSKERVLFWWKRCNRIENEKDQQRMLTVVNNNVLPLWLLLAHFQNCRLFVISYKALI